VTLSTKCTTSLAVVICANWASPFLDKEGETQ
jgi:hypothetical protein